MSHREAEKTGCCICGAKKTLRRVGEREFCKSHKAEADAACAQESRATSARHDAQYLENRMRRIQSLDAAGRRR